MIVALYFRLHASHTERLPELNVVYTGALVREEWMSIYLKGEKIGYTSRSMQKVGSDFLIQETSYLRLPVGGIKEEILFENLTTVDSTLKVKTSNFTLSAGDAEFNTGAKIEKDKINIFISSKEKKENLSIPIDGPIYTPSIIPMVLASDHFSKKVYEFPTFDPMTLSRTKFTVEVLQKNPAKQFKVKGDIWMIRLVWAGFSSTMYVSSDGRVIMEEGPSGMVSYADDKKGALNFTLNKGGEKDILLDFAVPATGLVPIARPRNLVFLTVQLQGIQPALFEIDGGYQHLIAPDTILISTAKYFPERSPDSTHLASTPFIQADDIRIKNKAKEIVGETTDTIFMLQKINKYLYENVKKVYRGTLPSALEVLSSMRGDCNEHSILFTALARALRIPTRIDVGLIYSEGRFLYHSWVSSYVYGRWHSFDPTLGQYPPDATHIRLISGDISRQLELLRMDNPTIKVLKYFNAQDTAANERLSEWKKEKARLWR